MTAIYDPKDPQYLDGPDVRAELTRVFDLCHGCQRCLTLCSTFPTLFDLIDRRDDRDAGRLSQAEQDLVVDECFQCKLCYVRCPYIPGQHEWELDFPRLMLRTGAMRAAAGDVPRRRRATNALMGRTDLLGKVNTRLARLVNRTLDQPGSPARRVVATVTGISAKRVLPPFARVRFTTWFKQRPKVRVGRRQGRVALFPTCLVEYQDPSIGQDLVKVYERNGIEVSLVEGARCCGAPWLHAGELGPFTEQAVENVKALADAVRKGNDIVVPQPTCGYVLKQDYRDYVGGPDADLVAANTYDAAEYLMQVHKAEGTRLDTDFLGAVPETITYHAPCHLRAQNIGLQSRDLMKLTGAKVRVVAQCSGIDGMWGLRAENDQRSIPVAQRLAEELDRVSGDTIAGDCHLANGAILEQTGRTPVHPLQVVARAYGIPEEDR